MLYGCHSHTAWETGASCGLTAWGTGASCGLTAWETGASCGLTAWETGVCCMDVTVILPGRLMHPVALLAVYFIDVKVLQSGRLLCNIWL